MRMPFNTWVPAVALSVVLFLNLIVRTVEITHSTECSCDQPGVWSESAYQMTDCENHRICTPHNLTWTSDCAHTVYGVAACEKLKEKGINRIYFIGDSYMRHIYQAFHIHLSGNYVSGGILQSDPKCLYDKQFSEKGCSMNYENKLQCNGDVDLVLEQKLDSKQLGKALKKLEDGSSIALLSFGNHHIARNTGRLGVNNASVWSHLLAKHHMECAVPGSHEKITRSCRQTNSYWVSTHQRLKAYFPDEFADVVQAFNEGMRAYVESHCSTLGFIDVFNMTESLVQNHRDEAITGTFDQVHWGMWVNLLKANIILKSILS